MTIDTSRAGVASADAGTVWSDTQALMRNVADWMGSNVEAGVSISGLGITNQRETTVFWDAETGEPLTEAILWLDRRTEATIDAWKAGGIAADEQARLQRATGLPLACYFSNGKIHHALNEVPAVVAAAAANRLRVGTIDSWLMYRLSGKQDHLIEVSNASRTGLMDLKTREWDEGALSTFGVPRGVLPRIVESSSPCLTRINCGSPLDGVPITGVLGDQQAALLGQGCVEAGDVKCTYGTGCFMLQNTGTTVHPSQSGLLTTVGWQLGAGAPITYALEGAIAVCGAGINWLIKDLGLVSSVQELNAEAESVSDTNGCTFVPVLAGLMAPHWREEARGVLLGLSQSTRRGHVCRAFLQGLACQVVDVATAMEADSGTAVRSLKVDGGVTKSNLLMQLQADLLRCTVMRAADEEATCRGALYAAMLGAGSIKTLGEVAALSAGASTSFSPGVHVAEEAGVKAVMGDWAAALSKTYDSDEGPAAKKQKK
jgi:glycerol kinase